MKDAIVGLAIFVTLLVFWRLLTRPERLGSLGPHLATNLFGAYGMGLAETLNRGRGQSTQLSGGANSSPATGHEPFSEQSNSAALLVTQPRSREGPSGTTEAPSLTNPVKIISDLPTEFADATSQSAPTASSPEASAMARRLDEAGAQTGDIQISLSWNNYNDLDLHCFDPQGEQIWYSNRKSSKTAGELDVDRNASEPFVAAPVENIFWPSGQAPAGIYKVYLVYYAQHPGPNPNPTAYTVRIVVEDKTNYLSGRIAYSGRKELNWICSVQYDPNNPDRTQHRRFLPNK